MARYEHIAIFQSAYMLTLEIYKTTKNFSREYKYTLGERLKNLTHELLDLVIKTNNMPGREKLDGIKQIDNKKEELRIHLRLAHDLKVISHGHLGVFNEKIEEIGKQAGGWAKWIASNPKQAETGK